MLQAHPDIDTVFAASDLMALGAIEAIAAAGKTGKIRVIGFDALDDAKKGDCGGDDGSVGGASFRMRWEGRSGECCESDGWREAPAEIMVKLRWSRRNRRRGRRSRRRTGAGTRLP